MSDISCFVCTTPFQIIGSVSIVMSEGILADLYVVPQFNDAEKMADRIREQKIFRKVIFVNTDTIEAYKRSGSKLRKAAGIVANYINVRPVVESIIDKDAEYSHLYISSKANIGRLFRLYFIRTRLDVQVTYIDDGESSYDNKMLITPSRSDYYIQLLLFGRKAVDYSYSLKLFSPELYHELNPDSEIPVSKLPAIEKNAETVRIFNSIFNVSEDDFIDERVVILDILKSNLLPGEADKLDRIYGSIIDAFGADNVVIKKHPRDASPANPGWKYYAKKNVPFEIFSLNTDISDKILITVSSTAVTMPKLLFDSEPTVIYLGALVDTVQGSIDKSRRYYEKIGEIYRDKSRFLIPQSVDELASIAAE